MWICETARCGLAHCARDHEHEEVRHVTILVQRHAAPLADRQPQTLIQNKVDHCLRDAVVRSRDAAVEASHTMHPVDVAYQLESGLFLTPAPANLHFS